MQAHFTTTESEHALFNYAFIDFYDRVTILLPLSLKGWHYRHVPHIWLTQEFVTTVCDLPTVLRFESPVL